MGKFWKNKIFVFRIGPFLMLLCQLMWIIFVFQDTCTGFLLGGIGEVNAKRQKNFFVVSKGNIYFFKSVFYSSVLDPRKSEEFTSMRYCPAHINGR